MAFRDLREWLAAIEAGGDVRVVNGAHWDVELGTIVDQYQRRMGLPALLFDNIVDYPQGYRILANTLTSTRRIALTLGLPLESTEKALVQAWRRHGGDYP